MSYPTPPNSQGFKRPYSMLFQPGFKAYEAGVSAASYAHMFLGEPSTKKTKSSNMPPIRRRNAKRANLANRSYVSKSKKAGTRSAIKNTMLSMATTYRQQISDNTCGATLLHNSIFSYNLSAQLGQGTGNTNRQGDQVYLEAVKFRGYVRSAATAGGYTYRVLVGWSGEEYIPAGLTTAGLSFAEIFLPQTGTYNGAAAIVNPKAFTVLFDSNVDINSQIAAVTDINSIVFNVPLKQKFAFQATASNYGKTKNLYIVVIGSLPGATAGVTGAGDAAINCDIIFKNL